MTSTEPLVMRKFGTLSGFFDLVITSHKMVDLSHCNKFGFSFQMHFGCRENIFIELNPVISIEIYLSYKLLLTQ